MTPGAGGRRPADDTALARRVAAGDEAAFAQLVLRFRPRLVRYAESRLGAFRGDGEDVVQEALLRARRALRDRDEPPDRLEAWLYAVVRNCASDAYRARERRATAPLHDGLVAPAGEPSAVVEASERLAQVTSAIAGLPERQREALVRTAVAGESYEAVAAGQETSVGAVKALVNRARTSVRRAAAAVLPLPWPVGDWLGSLGAARAGATGTIGLGVAKALAIGSAGIAAVGLAPVAAVKLGHQEARVAAVSQTHGSRDPQAARTVRREALVARTSGEHSARGEIGAAPAPDPVSRPSGDCPADRAEYGACGAGAASSG